MVETSAEMTGVVEGLISYHHGYSRRSDALADLQDG